MRSIILKDLHLAHQGIVKTAERAKTSLYWPGMQKQIADLFETCDICQENRSTNRHEPLMPQEVPASPQQKIAAYLFTVGGKDYIGGRRLLQQMDQHHRTESNEERRCHRGTPETVCRCWYPGGAGIRQRPSIRQLGVQVVYAKFGNCPQDIKSNICTGK